MFELPLSLLLIIFIYLFVAGSCCASFLLVVVHRSATPQSIPFYKGRSHCDSCGTELTPSDLIPIFSWLFHKGRCRHCGCSISVWYPISELIGGIAFVLSFVAYPFQFHKIAICLLTAICLLLISLYDSLTMEIPDRYTLYLCIPALLSLWAFPHISITQRLIGLVCISLPMLLINLLIGDAFGGGDVQLMAVCGFLLGWKLTLVGFFFGLIFASIQGIILLASGKAKIGQGAHIPFGPALCAGCYLSLLFGETVLRFYLSFFPS